MSKQADRAPLKRAFSFCVGGVWGGDPDGQNDVIVVRVADFDKQRGEVSLGEAPTVRAVPASARNRRLLKPGDLLLEKSGGGPSSPVGNVVQYNDSREAVCSNFVVRLVVKDRHSAAFLKYLFAGMYARGENVPHFTQTSGIQNLDTTSYLDQVVWLPSLTTQTAVANYLDTKTAAIDALIAKKELLIEELKKYQEALVEDELQAAAAQASERVKLKRLFAERSDRGHSNEQPLAATQHMGVVPKSMLDFKTMESLSEDYSGYKLVLPGDFVISLRSFEGGLELSQHRGVVSPAYTVLAPCDRVVQEYFQLLLKSHSFKQSLSVHKRGIRDGQSVPWSALREDTVPVPTVSVQVAVSQRVQAETGRVQRVSGVAERMVQALKAYRAAVISEAVTGKLQLPA